VIDHFTKGTPLATAMRGRVSPLFRTYHGTLRVSLPLALADKRSVLRFPVSAFRASILPCFFSAGNNVGSPLI
jgi:hypothetical protein